MSGISKHGPSPLRLPQPESVDPFESSAWSRPVSIDMLRINLAALRRQRFVIGFVRLVHQHVAAPVRKREGNTKEIFQTDAQFLSAFRCHEKQHETSSARAKQFSSKSTGAASCFIYLV